MNNVPHRIVIYAKDVMYITGKQERAAYRLLSKIRNKYGKPTHALISIDEFCEYTGLREERVITFLK